MQKTCSLNGQAIGTSNTMAYGQLRGLHQIAFKNIVADSGGFNVISLLRTPVQAANSSKIKASSNISWSPGGHAWNAHNGAFITFMSKSLGAIMLLPYAALTTAVVIWVAVSALGIADRMAKRKRKEE